ncbi:MAG: MFS transporter [Burkholderiaceae bacterium]
MSAPAQRADVAHDARRGRPSPIGLLALGLGTSVAPLDTLVNVAFPALSDAFAITVNEIQWVIIPFALVQTGLAISFGKLGDRLGHRRVFMLGLAIAALALAGCASATSFAMLVAMRVLQGIGTGLVIGVAPALVSWLYPPTQQRNAMAMYTALFGFGMAVGPLAGGWLVEHFGWAGVFWVRVPIALTALVLMIAARTIGDSQEARSARGVLTGKPFDIAGALLLGGWLMGIVAAANFWRAGGLNHAPTVMGAMATLFALVLFIRVERRAADPILHVDWLARASFRDYQLGSVLINLAAFANLLLLPYRLAQWPGLSITGAGALLMLYPAGAFVAGRLVPRLASAASANALMTTGLVICALALAGIGAQPWLPGLGALAVLLFTCGIGLGLYQIGHLEGTMASVPPHARGVAGSLAGVTRLFGLMLGAIVLPIVQSAFARLSATADAMAATFAATGLSLLLLAGVFALRNRPGGR